MRSPTTQVCKARRRYLGYPSPDAVVWACRDFGNRRKQLPFLPLSRQPAAALQSHGLCIMHFLTIACKRGWVVGLGISAQIKPSICLAQITLTSSMIKMWACGKPRACNWRQVSALYFRFEINYLPFNSVTMSQHVAKQFLFAYHFHHGIEF